MFDASKSVLFQKSQHFIDHIKFSDMSQQVLCCFSCKTFQVSQVKKDPKWVCKMCNEKQSLKQIFGR